MACATPLASRMARAIVAYIRTTRRMLTPLVPLHVPRRSDCTQGNRAVRLGYFLGEPRTTREVQHGPGPNDAGPPAHSQQKSRAALGGGGFRGRPA
jgi:hypothetical protein